MVMTRPTSAPQPPFTCGPQRFHVKHPSHEICTRNLTLSRATRVVEILLFVRNRKNCLHVHKAGFFDPTLKFFAITRSLASPGRCQQERSKEFSGNRKVPPPSRPTGRGVVKDWHIASLGRRASKPPSRVH